MGEIARRIPFIMQEDIRWKQRFQNYGKALMLLEEAVDANREADRELIKAGIIQ
jgi:hypothetical protein